MNNTELKMDELQELKPIDFNYEEMKEKLSLELKKYENLIFEEKDIKEAKETRADLNRLKKQINDKKIEVKKEFSKPYIEFENKIKEILEMIDKPVLAIDNQIKNFEQRQKEIKQKEIIKIYEDNIEDLKEILSIQKIWNEKWLNATYKIGDIELEILGIINKVKTDLKVIEDMQSEFVVQLKDKYLQTLDLTTVMQEKARLESFKKNEEIRKQQEEIKKEESKNAFDDILQNTTKKITVTFKITEKQIQELRQWLIINKISYESEDL